MEEHLSAQRKSGKRDTSSHYKHAATPRGRRLAGESALSRYLGEDKQIYVWQGLNNPIAAKIKAKLDELGVA